jgi:hypothetical protein
MTIYKYKLNDKIQIPTHWSAEQAQTVWEFLQEICSAIWDVHDQNLVDLYLKEQAILDRSAPTDDDPQNHNFEDDDIPFE